MNAKEFAVALIEKSIEMNDKKLATIYVRTATRMDDEPKYNYLAVDVQIYLGGYDAACERRMEDEWQWDYCLYGDFNTNYAAEIQKIDDLILNWIGG